MRVVKAPYVGRILAGIGDPSRTTLIIRLTGSQAIAEGVSRLHQEHRLRMWVREVGPVRDLCIGAEHY